MYYLHHSGTAFAAIVAGTIASTHAQAGVRVGGVTSVVHDVASSVSGQSWAKKVEGDDVSEDEFIRTETESSARISFVDETDIRMGPAARMKIDRVVFKSGRAVSELVVTAEAGGMRWNSGVSQSNAYLIKTPTVIIKVRGTTFDLFAEPQQTTVVLRRGTIEVCTIDTPQRCQTLSRPGDTVIGTPNVLDRPRRAGPGPSDFADRCLSARAMAPCAILASVQPTRSGSVTPRTTPSVTPATKRVEFERAPRGPRVVYNAELPEWRTRLVRQGLLYGPVRDVSLWASEDLWAAYEDFWFWVYPTRTSSYGLSYEDFWLLGLSACEDLLGSARTYVPARDCDVPARNFHCACGDVTDTGPDRLIGPNKVIELS